VSTLPEETDGGGASEERGDLERRRTPTPRSVVHVQELWREDHSAAAREPMRKLASLVSGERRVGSFAEIFAPRSPRPVLSGVDTVALHLDVQGL